MKIKRWHLLATCIGLTLLLVISALAIHLPHRWRQAPPNASPPSGANQSRRDQVVAGQPRSFQKAQLELERKQVKGTPFSAELTIEMPQYSTDGTSKSVVLQSLVYRDVNGRTRREQKTGAEPAELATINDFVAGVSYVLQPRLQVARKHAIEPMNDNAESEVANHSGAKSTSRYQVLPSGTTSADAGSTRSVVSRTAPTVAESSLGERLIEGIKVEGKQTTTTIPPNSFGNPQPIVIVEERWYSAELRTVVLIKYSDPRFGDSSYRLANISRTEPSANLFVVPEQYTVHDEVLKPRQ